MKAEAYYPFSVHLQDYSQKDPKCKARYILDNFSRFPKMIEGYESDWKITVKAEKRYNFLKEMGDPGIRVQASKISNPTMNQAISKFEEDTATTAKDIRSLVHGTDDPGRRIMEKMVIADMKDDYEIILNAIHRLDSSDENLFLPYIRTEKTIQEVADELQVQYSSAKNKMRRLKKMVLFTATENIRHKNEIIKRRYGDDKK